MSVPAAEAAGDTSFSQDPLDLDMSGFVPTQSAVLPAREAWTPMDSTEAGGRSIQAGPEAREGAKKVLPAPSAAVPSPPPARVRQEPLKPHEAAKVAISLRPAHKTHTRPKMHDRKITRALRRSEHRKGVRSARPVKRLQAEPGSRQHVGRGSAGMVPGGGPGHGGTANVNGPGGSGLSEMGFGSPNGPRFLHVAAPAYPTLAKRLAKEGTVLLRVTIDKRGRPIEVEVLRKAGFGMDDAAVRAVEQSRFIPARRDGKSIACKALIPIKFVLETSSRKGVF